MEGRGQKRVATELEGEGVMGALALVKIWGGKERIGRSRPLEEEWVSSWVNKWSEREMRHILRKLGCYTKPRAMGASKVA